VIGLPLSTQSLALGLGLSVAPGTESPVAEPPAEPVAIEFDAGAEKPERSGEPRESGELPQSGDADQSDAEARAAKQAALAEMGLDDVSMASGEEQTPPEAPALALPLPNEPAAESPPPVAAVSPPPEPSSRSARRKRAKTPPRELTWRLDVHAGAGFQTVFHPSYQAFDDVDRRLTMVRLAAAADRSFGPRIFVGGGVAYAQGSTSSTSFLGSARTSLRVDEPIFFGRLSILPVEGIDLFANLGVGPSVFDIEFNESSAALGFAAQKSVTFVAEGLAGLMAYLPQKWLPRGGSSHVTGGIDLHLGYAFRGPVTVSPSPELDEDPIPTTASSFGRLQARGLSWNLGLFVRFQ
jgi:hypothetical protein